MTAPTVTLEDVAEVCDVPRYAALVRAAAKVVEAAKGVDSPTSSDGWKTWVPGLANLREALAAFDKISRGEA